MNHPEHAGHGHGHGHGGGAKKGLHRDWRTWTVVVLMLVAMAVYVMSNDESLRPGDVPQQPEVPAAAP